MGRSFCQSLFLSRLSPHRTRAFGEIIKKSMTRAKWEPSNGPQVKRLTQITKVNTANTTKNQAGQNQRRKNVTQTRKPSVPKPIFQRTFKANTKTNSKRLTPITTVASMRLSSKLWVTRFRSRSRTTLRHASSITDNPVTGESTAKAKAENMTAKNMTAKNMTAKKLTAKKLT